MFKIASCFLFIGFFLNVIPAAFAEGDCLESGQKEFSCKTSCGPGEKDVSVDGSCDGGLKCCYKKPAREINAAKAKKTKGRGIASMNDECVCVNSDGDRLETGQNCSYGRPADGACTATLPECTSATPYCRRVRR